LPSASPQIANLFLLNGKIFAAKFSGFIIAAIAWPD
jgi:hypothetical protein